MWEAVRIKQNTKTLWNKARKIYKRKIQTKKKAEARESELKLYEMTRSSFKKAMKIVEQVEREALKRQV